MSFVPLLGIADAIKNSANAAMKGDMPGAIAHGIGGAVGEVPVVGDVAVESVSGSPVRTGTQTNQRQSEVTTPSRYNKQGPDLTTPAQSRRAQELRISPKSERGYETIGRVLQQGAEAAGSWMKKLGINLF